MLIDNDERDYQLDTNNLFEFIDGGPVANIDADPIAYSAASVCDTAIHKIFINGIFAYEVEGGVTSLYKAFSIKDKREWDALLLRNPDVSHEKVVISDADSSSMFHTIKAQVKKIIKRTGAGSIRLYLTDGASNFRLTQNIATILKYKGNRATDAKPLLLKDARKYLMEELGAELCVGLEADDRLSIVHNQAWESAMLESKDFYLTETDISQEVLEKKAMELTKSVLVTIDKDIKMRAGLFMNPDQDIGVEEIYPMGHLHLEIKPKKANKASEKKLHFSGLKGFYAQILMGDTCDNIVGVYFCGQVKAYDVLKDCETEEDLFKATLSEIYEGFHREHIKALDYDIHDRVEQAIANGAKDSEGNRTKLRKKFKDYLLSNVQFINKHYYHWSSYDVEEDGTVSNRLLPNLDHEVLTLSPYLYMEEVARLLYMLIKEPSSDDSHLWTAPVTQWISDVHCRYTDLNLERVRTSWLLPSE